MTGGTVVELVTSGARPLLRCCGLGPPLGGNTKGLPGNAQARLPTQTYATPDAALTPDIPGKITEGGHVQQQQTGIPKANNATSYYNPLAAETRRLPACQVR